MTTNPYCSPLRKSRILRQLLGASLFAALALQPLGAEVLLGWEMNGLTSFGASPLTATTTNPAVSTTGLTRGAGITTTGTAAGNAWGGNGVNAADFAAAVTAADFATFNVTIGGELPVALTSIAPYNIRRSGTGATTGQWQYSLDGTTFTNIGSAITWGTNTAAAGNGQAEIDLSGIGDLQSLDPDDTVTFRVVVYGGTQATGTWYFNQFQAGDDLILNGTINPGGGDVTPPAITTRAPADNAVDLEAASITQIVFSYSENVTAGTGSLLIKRVVDDSVFASIDINNVFVTSIIDNTVTMDLPTALEEGTDYYIEIPAGLVVDGSSNPSEEITGNTAWNFSTASPPEAPVVVINKILNGSSIPLDAVELLVVGDGIPGSTVDLGGMIIKDFSSSIGGDNGGRFSFNEDVFWEAIPVGTLITLTNDAVTTDTTTDTTAGDFTLAIGLNDTGYFTKIGSTSFDISTSDMVMIKAAGSDPNGVSGGIHAVANGTGLYYSSYPGYKLLASGSLSSGNGIVALNSTSALNDYNGTDVALGALSITAFGLPNNGTNAGYIATLRGITPGDGDGAVILTNVSTGSPFLDSGIFARGASDQTVKLALSATIPGATVTRVEITVPAELGAPLLENISLSGDGVAGATPSVSGQVITIDDAAVTTTASLEVTIDGLSTPSPSGVTDTGNYIFGVSTASATGDLTAIDVPPAARVLIPIASVRDNTVTGVPADNGTIVALEGVVTEANFSAVDATNYSGFIQDATGGINVFSTAFNPNLVRGSRFAVLGTITHFNGLTEIIPLSTANVISLGADTEPAPQLVTALELITNPEDYEGELVKVENFTYVSGTWGAASTVVLSSGGTNLDIRIQAGSDATTEPSYPVTIVGVFGQFDSSSPYSSGYQLMPRDAADLTAGTSNNYTTWAATNIGGGLPGDDHDGDGITNLVEYALATNLSGSDGSLSGLSGGGISFTKRAAAFANGDVTYAIETSVNLSDWDPATPTVNDATTISYTLPTGEGRIFARLVITQN